MTTEGEEFSTEAQAKEAADKTFSPYIVKLYGGGYMWLAAEEKVPQGSRIISQWRLESKAGYPRRGWKDVGSG